MANNSYVMVFPNCVKVFVSVDTVDLCTETCPINLSVMYIPGRQDVVANQLSHHNQIIPTGTYMSHLCSPPSWVVYVPPAI